MTSISFIQSRTSLRHTTYLSCYNKYEKPEYLFGLIFEKKMSVLDGREEIQGFNNLKK